MPYTKSQNRLFWLAANNPEVAKARGIPMETARRLASEGIKGKKKNKLSEKAKK